MSAGHVLTLAAALTVERVVTGPDQAIGWYPGEAAQLMAEALPLTAARRTSLAMETNALTRRWRAEPEAAA